jgi:hypothetical protein
MSLLGHLEIRLPWKLGSCRGRKRVTRMLPWPRLRPPPVAFLSDWDDSSVAFDPLVVSLKDVSSAVVRLNDGRDDGIHQIDQNFAAILLNARRIEILPLFLHLKQVW